jgi:hypothetical protein
VLLLAAACCLLLLLLLAAACCLLLLAAAACCLLLAAAAAAAAAAAHQGAGGRTRCRAAFLHFLPILQQSTLHTARSANFIKITGLLVLKIMQPAPFSSARVAVLVLVPVVLKLY